MGGRLLLLLGACMPGVCTASPGQRRLPLLLFEPPLHPPLNSALPPSSSAAVGPHLAEMQAGLQAMEAHLGAHSPLLAAALRCAGRRRAAGAAAGLLLLA